MLISVIVAALAGTAPLSAEPNMIELRAEVASLCSATTAGGETLDATTVTFEVEDGRIDATQREVAVVFACNDASGFTQTITSSNGGFLVREGSAGGANDRISYAVAANAPAGLGFAATQLLAPRARSIGGSGELLAGVPALLSIRLTDSDAPGTSGLFAGSYSDTLTVSITSN